MIQEYLIQTTKVEQEIVFLLNNGDRSAISLAYKHYGANLYGVILNILKKEEEAQEVLQDTFVKIWKNADKYDANKGRLFTWMINIARRAAIDMTRSANFKASKKTDSIQENNNLQNNWTTSDEIQDIGLQKVLDSMDEKYRVIIDLVYFQGYTQSELQKVLDIPLGTVKSRVRLALKDLRNKLSDPANGNYLSALALIIQSLKNVI